MELRELGRTQVAIPAIGLGTWKYTAGPVPLRRGIESGAALLDTAEIYGTEEVVGEAIAGIRERVFVATKVYPGHFRFKDVLRAAEESLRRLRTDVIDLYQLHWPSRSVPIEETIAALEQLVDDGKVRFLGVSNFGGRRLEQARSALRKHPLVSNQIEYSLVQRAPEHGLLDRCRKIGVTVLAYSPLGAGLDVLRGRDRHGSLQRAAAREGRSAAQVALNWCLSKGVVVIPKASSIERVQENCAASGWRLSEESVRDLERSFRRPGPVEDAVRRAARHLRRRLRR